MATTYQKYIDEKNLDVYSSTKIKLPEPELYVLYIGDRKKRPKEIKFSEEFFDGKDISVRRHIMGGANRTLISAETHL